MEQMYLDSFLRIAHLEGMDITPTLDKLEKISETYNITFVLSVSMDESELPENAKSKVIISL